MGKKHLANLDVDEVDLAFDPTQAAAKMPIDISGGKRVLMEYMEIPIDCIDPYEDKRGSDFSDYEEQLSEAMVNSIRTFGVIEAITVRAKADGRYELLAGERRWMHAKKAGLEVIPAHVIQAEPKVARAIFSLTNILRRPIVYRDLIYGWWQFYVSLKEEGRLGEMRQSGSSEISPETKSQLGLDGKSLSYRQMMRYVRMHNLVDGWISALDNNQVTLRVAEVVASLDESKQLDILPFIDIIDEDKARALVGLAKGELKGKSWSEEAIQTILAGVTVKKPKQESPSAAAFKKARPKILKSVQNYLREDDYGRAEEVIKAALDLYYSQN